jgi:quinol monooxygenase YgiN
MVIRGMVLAMLLVAGIGAAQAQAPAPPAATQPAAGNWVITYLEVAPGSETKALAALKSLKTASTKDNGYLSMTVLQRNGYPNHFALIEHWKDNKTRETHAEQPHVKAVRETLRQIEIAP